MDDPLEPCKRTACARYDVRAAPTHVPIHLSIYLSIYLSLSLYIYIYCLSLSLYIYIHIQMTQRTTKATLETALYCIGVSTGTYGRLCM